jgi:GMP reductase
MKSVLTPDICKKFDEKGWFYVYHRINGVSDVERFVVEANSAITTWNTVSISVGVGGEWCDLIDRLNAAGLRIDSFTVDVALSYNDNVLPILNKIKTKFPSAYLIVGNGATPEWINWLEDLGVNCAKIGIGVSRACRTRQFTGFGSTTVTSLLRCVESAKYIDVMSDGGLTVDQRGEVWIGDINKALVLGADYVMSGAIFSRCIDSPSLIDGYYGNASAHAKQSTTHVEGTKFAVETSGLTISQTCDLILDSIKSGISYAGGNDLSAFRSVEWQIVK